MKDSISISKRTFLKLLTIGSTGLLLSQTLSGCSKPAFLSQHKNIIIGGGKFVKPESPGSVNFVLSIVNLALKDKRLIPLDFLAHSINIDPKNYSRLIVFEKIGPGACVVDLDTMQVVKKVTTTNDKHFYGHGVFSGDGHLLYNTETYLNSKKGIIAIRDANTMESLEEFPTYGDNPHECQLIDNGKVMVVTNAGSAIGSNIEPSVTYIDVNSQQLLERVTLTNNRVNTGHIGIAEDGSLVVASAPRDGLKKTDLGAVSIRPNGKEIETMGSPYKIVNAMVGEALSVIIHDKSNTAAVTHPDGNLVTFWSINERKLLKFIEVDKPRGVTLTLDETTFVISYGINTDIMLVNIETLKENINSTITATYLSGSHIYNWSKTLKEILPINAMT